MRFVRFDGGKTGVVVTKAGVDQVVDVVGSLAAFGAFDGAASRAIAAVLPAQGAQAWTEMISQWDALRGPFRSLAAWAEGDAAGLRSQPLAQAALEAPLPSPGVHIFSFSSNTVVHIQRAFKVMKDLDLGEDEVLGPKRRGLPPGGFTIWPDTVVGPGATITPPRGARLLDYEGECAVILQRGGRDLERVDLWGYAAWNDLGIRDTHLGLRDEAPWSPFSMNLPKNFDTGNAMGPWVVVDEDIDLQNLRCTVRVNGDLRQDWQLKDMIYSFEEMFTYLSKWTRLRPGDIVTSGTGAGVAIEGGLNGADWLGPGDVVEVSVDGAGTLVNPIGPW